MSTEIYVPLQYESDPICKGVRTPDAFTACMAYADAASRLDAAMELLEARKRGERAGMSAEAAGRFWRSARDHYHATLERFVV